MRSATVFVFLLLIPTTIWAQPSDCQPDSVLAPITEAATVGTPRLSDEPPIRLGDALAELSESDAHVRAIARVLGMDPGAVRFMMANHTLAEQLTKVKVSQLIRLVDLVQAVNEVSPEKERVGPPWTLAARVKLSDAADQFDGVLPYPKASIGKLAIWDGFPANVSGPVVRRRKAGAEILTRLTLNASLPESERFVVEYRNKELTSVDDFVAALKASGHQVRSWVHQDVANFVWPYWEEEPGVLREVFSPILLYTDYQTDEGDPVVVPATHSALVFEIRGPDFNTTVEFFQGTRGTKFYPSGFLVDQSWSGGHTVETFGPAKSERALAASALWIDGVTSLAAERDLALGGYGATGVCNDAVAVIQQLVTGRTTAYPLIMDKDLVVPFLEELARKRPVLATRYRALAAAAKALPYDGSIEPDPTQPARILESIPFADDDPTPYAGVRDARRTLQRR